MFEAYNKKDLQTCKAILQQLESDGVVDLGFGIKKIEEFIHNDLLQHRKVAATTRRRFAETGAKRPSSSSDVLETKTCPGCGAAMQMGKWLEGVRYNGCPQCYYSEVANG